MAFRALDEGSGYFMLNGFLLIGCFWYQEIRILVHLFSDFLFFIHGLVALSYFQNGFILIMIQSSVISFS